MRLARSTFTWLKCALLAIASPTLGQDTPTAQLDRNEIYLGESVRLTLSVPGASDADQPDLSQVPDADLAFEGSRSESRTQITFINGQMRREGFHGRHYVWRLTPRREGTLQLGPIHVPAGNKNWTLEGPLLLVRPIPKQDFCSLDLEFSPSNPVPEEPVLVTLKIRFRRLPHPFSDLPPWTADTPLHLTAPFLDGAPKSGLEYPEIPALLQKFRTSSRAPSFFVNQYLETVDPFSADPFFSPQSLFDRKPARFAFERSDATLPAAEEMEFRFSFTVKPLEEGDYPFGPVTLKGEVIRAVTPDRRPILSPLYTVLPTRLLSVRPPPIEGRPPSYFGLIGSNLLADAQLETSRCRVGDPIRLMLHLSGPFNWNRTSTPDLSRQPALTNVPFHFYPQAVQTIKRDNGRTWEYLLRPQTTGTLELPGIELSWFDLATRSYQTLRTPPLPLQVESAPKWKEDAEDAMTPPDMASRPQTILSLQNAPAALRLPPHYPVTDRHPPWLWLLALAGPVLRLFFPFVRFVRRMTSEFLLWLQRVWAVPKARRRLKHWSHRSAPPMEQAASLCQIMRELASDWLGEPLEGLTPHDIARKLERHGATPENISPFESEMQRAFDASFNPAAPPLNPAEILKRLPPLWIQLDRQVRRSKTPFLHVLRLLWILILPGIVGAYAPTELDPAWKEFAWEEAMAAAGRARSADEFLAAAERFKQFARKTQLRNGELFYNWGLCLLLAGNQKEARHLFARAERYLGRPPDLVRNMSLAADSDSDHPLPLDQFGRLLFWPHFGFPWRWRSLIAAAAFSLWILLLCGSNIKHSTLRSIAATLMLILFLFFAASSLLTTYQEYQDTVFLQTHS